MGRSALVDELDDPSLMANGGSYRKEVAGEGYHPHPFGLLRTGPACSRQRKRSFARIMGSRGPEMKVARPSEMGRFETGLLNQESNRTGLARTSANCVERAMAHPSRRRAFLDLDLDRSESPVHRQQEGATNNVHFECVCVHPLFRFKQFGDCEVAKLRPGNFHGVDGWSEALDPALERYLKAAVRPLFRADAAFSKPEIYEYLETRQIEYAIRLRANVVVHR